MRKYWAIAKTYTKTQLVWRADVIFNMIFTISRILFAYLLWGILFQGKETVGMFTFHGILSYYIVNSFLSQLEMSDGISGEIHYRIRNGTFSKYMVIPAGIELYFMAMELGVVLFYLGFGSRVDLRIQDPVCLCDGMVCDRVRCHYGGAGNGLYGAAQLFSRSADFEIPGHRHISDDQE